ncbi:MAG TPA: alpha/beta fold hydrolase [Anaeromyxobacteraceae bacterium]|nr:alpha/beta fold hydrolase [Anaeromyxobacteraceae bacterium]
MPRLRVNGVDLYYESTGTGPETVVLSHGLLLSGDMFREQVRHLAPRYRVVVYDHRGQGRSEVAATGYDMDTLAADAAALVEALGAAPCHFAGVSMGGFVAMRLAARRPELLRSCVLMETSADPEAAENVPRYRMLNWAVRLLGARAVADKVMPIMFGKSFLADPARAELRAEWRGRFRALRRSIHRSVTGVIERSGVYQELQGISVPTLVLVGEEDVATPPPRAERIQAAIRGSRLLRIPRAGHSSTIENPEAVNAALDGFLAGLPRPTAAAPGAR